LPVLPSAGPCGARGDVGGAGARPMRECASSRSVRRYEIMSFIHALLHCGGGAVGGWLRAALVRRSGYLLG
ncbi:hypothetical protein, partial [Stutzerimonas balearica]|uniref:hypothetical protein n=1 Tax=Stutzerimonas balearica TaxID=74829 RepID=UPI0028B23A5C